MYTDYDAVVPIQDMLAQLTANNLILFPVQPRPVSIKYTFEERARIAQAFFDLLSFAKYNANLDRQIFIVDDLISFCTRQERRPRKPRQS